MARRAGVRVEPKSCLGRETSMSETIVLDKTARRRSPAVMAGYRADGDRCGLQRPDLGGEHGKQEEREQRRD